MFKSKEILNPSPLLRYLNLKNPPNISQVTDKSLFRANDDTRGRARPSSRFSEVATPVLVGGQVRLRWWPRPSLWVATSVFVGGHVRPRPCQVVSVFIRGHVHHRQSSSWCPSSFRLVSSSTSYPSSSSPSLSSPSSSSPSSSSPSSSVTRFFLLSLAKKK